MGIFPTDDSMDPYYIISHPDTVFESNQPERENEILGLSNFEQFDNKTTDTKIYSW